MDLTLPHIDLLSVTRAYGYYSGLKACEKMGIRREFSIAHDGEDAVLLWRRYSDYGDKNALEKLVIYNCMDVFSLEIILIRLFNESIRSWPHFRKYPVATQPDPVHSFQSFFDK